MPKQAASSSLRSKERVDLSQSVNAADVTADPRGENKKEIPLVSRIQQISLKKLRKQERGWGSVLFSETSGLSIPTKKGHQRPQAGYAEVMHLLSSATIDTFHSVAEKLAKYQFKIIAKGIDKRLREVVMQMITGNPDSISQSLDDPWPAWLCPWSKSKNSITGSLGSSAPWAKEVILLLEILVSLATRCSKDAPVKAIQAMRVLEQRAFASIRNRHLLPFNVLLLGPNSNLSCMNWMRKRQQNSGSGRSIDANESQEEDNVEEEEEASEASSNDEGDSDINESDSKAKETIPLGADTNVLSDSHSSKASKEEGIKPIQPPEVPSIESAEEEDEDDDDAWMKDLAGADDEGQDADQIQSQNAFDEGIEHPPTPNPLNPVRSIAPEDPLYSIPLLNPEPSSQPLTIPQAFILKESLHFTQFFFLFQAYSALVSLYFSFLTH